MKNNPHDLAFTLGNGDKFFSIIVSEGVKYETDPDVETVITFFVIKRRKGHHDIVVVIKTFKGEVCVSRNVQNKKGITRDTISKEVDDIAKVFSKGIEDAVGYRMTWHTLDLSLVDDLPQQVERISKWNRVDVRLAAEIPPIGMN